MMSYALYNSPVDTLLLLADERGLLEVRFAGQQAEAVQQFADCWQQGCGVIERATQQLDAYFAGQLTEFDLPLVYSGTDFQQQVMHALRTIPYGKTCSYGELAKQLGRAGAARAVGSANRRNPLPIIVPCHRVIGASGELTGFAGGLEIKRQLLAIEGALTA